MTETITMIVDYVTHHNIDLQVPISEVVPLLRLCITDVYFTFLGKSYVQTDGVAMGSPLGPILADLFVAHLESSVSMLNSNKLFYRRYVDDILVFADNSEQLDELRLELNSLHPKIRFSVEVERENQLPLLDILMQRRPDGSISRSVYHKITWTGQYLNFNSFVPAKHK